MIQIDKIELQITQLKKELKKQESEADKCAYYEILAQIEDLDVLKSKVEKAKLKVLEESPANQFKNNGKYNLETLFWYLWDNNDA